MRQRAQRAQRAQLADLPTVGRRQTTRVSYRPAAEAPLDWRERASHHMTLVQRAIHGASDEATSGIGFADAVVALRNGSVGELLITRRFVEQHPAAAANTMLLAAIFGARTTTVTGPSEMILDLAAGGIAALARRTADSV